MLDCCGACALLCAALYCLDLWTVPSGLYSCRLHQRSAVDLAGDLHTTNLTTYMEVLVDTRC